MPAGAHASRPRSWISASRPRSEPSGCSQLGLSTGTVSSRLHHARQELRDVLEERGFTVEDVTT